MYMKSSMTPLRELGHIIVDLECVAIGINNFLLRSYSAYFPEIGDFLSQPCRDILDSIWRRLQLQNAGPFASRIASLTVEFRGLLRAYSTSSGEVT